MNEPEEKQSDQTAMQEPVVTPTSGGVGKPPERRVRAAAVGIFSGPLPPPEILARYDEIVPGAADRILVMAEKQADHRRYLERRVIDSDMTRSAQGLILGFVLVLVLGLGGIGLMAAGQSVNGLVALLGTLVTMAGIFVYAHESRKRERQERSKSAEERAEEQLSLFE